MKHSKMLVPFDRDRSYMESSLRILQGLTSITNASASNHAGGSSHKGKKAVVSADCAIESTGGDGAPVVAASDDDGDGDGDPDSDRRKSHSHPATLRKALDRKRVNESTRIIRMAELKTRIGLSRSTIYELIKSGNFPSSISLGLRAVGWLSSDLDNWLESRIQSSKA